MSRIATTASAPPDGQTEVIARPRPQSAKSALLTPSNPLVRPGEKDTKLRGRPRSAVPASTSSPGKRSRRHPFAPPAPQPRPTLSSIVMAPCRCNNGGSGVCCGLISTTNNSRDAITCAETVGIGGSLADSLAYIETFLDAKLGSFSRAEIAEALLRENDVEELGEDEKKHGATMETIPLGAPVSFQNMSRRIAWDATTVINPNAHGTALTIIPTTPTSNRVRGTRDVLTSHGPGTHEAMSMSLGGGVGKFPWGNSKRSARDKVLPKSPPPPPTPGTRAVRSPESPRDGGVGSGRRIELGGVERDDEIDAEEEARRDYPAHLRRLRAALAHSADASDPNVVTRTGTTMPQSDHPRGGREHGRIETRYRHLQTNTRDYDGEFMARSQRVAESPEDEVIMNSYSALDKLQFILQSGIAQHLVPALLPWPAVGCPRAIESLLALHLDAVYEQTVQCTEAALRQAKQLVASFVSSMSLQYSSLQQTVETSWRSIDATASSAVSGIVMKLRDEIVMAEAEARLKDRDSLVSTCKNMVIYEARSENSRCAFGAGVDVTSIITDVGRREADSDWREFAEWVHTIFIGPAEITATSSNLVLTEPKIAPALAVEHIAADTASPAPTDPSNICTLVGSTLAVEASALDRERDVVAQWAVDASLRVDQLRASVTVALDALGNDLLQISDAAHRQVQQRIVRLRVLCRAFVLYLDSLNVKSTYIPLQRSSESLWSSRHSAVFEKQFVSQITRLLRELNVDIETKREESSRWTKQLKITAQVARQNLLHASGQKEEHIRRCDEAQIFFARLLRSNWGAVISPPQHSLSLYKSQLMLALCGAKEHLRSAFHDFVRTLRSEEHMLLHARLTERRKDFLLFRKRWVRGIQSIQREHIQQLRDSLQSDLEIKRLTPALPEGEPVDVEQRIERELLQKHASWIQSWISDASQSAAVESCLQICSDTGISTSKDSLEAWMEDRMILIDQHNAYIRQSIDVSIADVRLILRDTQSFLVYWRSRMKDAKREVREALQHLRDAFTYGLWNSFAKDEQQVAALEQIHIHRLSFFVSSLTSNCIQSRCDVSFLSGLAQAATSKITTFLNWCNDGLCNRDLDALRSLSPVEFVEAYSNSNDDAKLRDSIFCPSVPVESEMRKNASECTDSVSIVQCTENATVLNFEDMARLVVRFVESSPSCKHRVRPAFLRRLRGDLQQLDGSMCIDHTLVLRTMVVALGALWSTLSCLGRDSGDDFISICLLSGSEGHTATDKAIFCLSCASLLLFNQECSTYSLANADGERSSGYRVDSTLIVEYASVHFNDCVAAGLLTMWMHRKHRISTLSYSSATPGHKDDHKEDKTMSSSPILDLLLRTETQIVFAQYCPSAACESDSDPEIGRSSPDEIVNLLLQAVPESNRASSDVNKSQNIDSENYTHCEAVSSKDADDAYFQCMLSLATSAPRASTSRTVGVLVEATAIRRLAVWCRLAAFFVAGSEDDGRLDGGRGVESFSCILSECASKLTHPISVRRADDVGSIEDTAPLSITLFDAAEACIDHIMTCFAPVSLSRLSASLLLASMASHGLDVCTHSIAGTPLCPNLAMARAHIRCLVDKVFDQSTIDMRTPSITMDFKFPEGFVVPEVFTLDALRSFVVCAGLPSQGLTSLMYIAVMARASIVQSSGNRVRERADIDTSDTSRDEPFDRVAFAGVSTAMSRKNALKILESDILTASGANIDNTVFWISPGYVRLADAKEAIAAVPGNLLSAYENWKQNEWNHACPREATMKILGLTVTLVACIDRSEHQSEILAIQGTNCIESRSSEAVLNDYLINDVLECHNAWVRHVHSGRRVRVVERLEIYRLLAKYLNADMKRAEDDLYAVCSLFPPFVDADDIASQLNKLCNDLLNSTEILRRLCRSEVPLMENLVRSARDVYIAIESSMTVAKEELESFVAAREESLSQRIQGACLDKSKLSFLNSIKQIAELNYNQMREIEAELNNFSKDPFEGLESQADGTVDAASISVSSAIEEHLSLFRAENRDFPRSWMAAIEAAHPIVTSVNSFASDPDSWEGVALYAIGTIDVKRLLVDVEGDVLEREIAHIYAVASALKLSILPDMIAAVMKRIQEMFHRASDVVSQRCECFESKLNTIAGNADCSADDCISECIEEFKVEVKAMVEQHNSTHADDCETFIAAAIVPRVLGGLRSSLSQHCGHWKEVQRNLVHDTTLSFDFPVLGVDSSTSGLEMIQCLLVKRFAETADRAYQIADTRLVARVHSSLDSLRDFIVNRTHNNNWDCDSMQVELAEKLHDLMDQHMASSVHLFSEISGLLGAMTDKLAHRLRETRENNELKLNSVLEEAIQGIDETVSALEASLRQLFLEFSDELRARISSWNSAVLLQLEEQGAGPAVSAEVPGALDSAATDATTEEGDYGSDTGMGSGKYSYDGDHMKPHTDDATGQVRTFNSGNRSYEEDLRRYDGRVEIASAVLPDHIDSAVAASSAGADVGTSMRRLPSFSARQLFAAALGAASQGSSASDDADASGDTEREAVRARDYSAAVVTEVQGSLLGESPEFNFESSGESNPPQRDSVYSLVARSATGASGNQVVGDLQVGRDEDGAEGEAVKPFDDVCLERHEHQQFAGEYIAAEERQGIAETLDIDGDIGQSHEAFSCDPQLVLYQPENRSSEEKQESNNAWEGDHYYSTKTQHDALVDVSARTTEQSHERQFFGEQQYQHDVELFEEPNDWSWQDASYSAANQQAATDIFMDTVDASAFEVYSPIDNAQDPPTADPDGEVDDHRKSEEPLEEPKKGNTSWGVQENLYAYGEDQQADTVGYTKSLEEAQNLWLAASVDVSTKVQQQQDHEANLQMLNPSAHDYQQKQPEHVESYDEAGQRLDNFEDHHEDSYANTQYPGGWFGEEQNQGAQPYADADIYAGAWQGYYDTEATPFQENDTTRVTPEMRYYPEGEWNVSFNDGALIAAPGDTTHGYAGAVEFTEGKEIENFDEEERNVNVEPYEMDLGLGGYLDFGEPDTVENFSYSAPNSDMLGDLNSRNTSEKVKDAVTAPFESLSLFDSFGRESMGIHLDDHPGDATVSQKLVWAAFYDSAKASEYFYNIQSGETSWLEPDPVSAMVVRLPSEWSAFMDDSGSVYYYNNETKASQWEHPALHQSMGAPPVGPISEEETGEILSAALHEVEEEEEEGEDEIEDDEGYDIDIGYLYADSYDVDARSDMDIDLVEDETDGQIMDSESLLLFSRGASEARADVEMQLARRWALSCQKLDTALVRIRTECAEACSDSFRDAYNQMEDGVDTVVQLINERVHGLMRESDVILQTEVSVRGMLSSFETAERSARLAIRELDASDSGAHAASRSSVGSKEFIKDALERYSASVTAHNDRAERTFRDLQGTWASVKARVSGYLGIAQNTADRAVDDAFTRGTSLLSTFDQQEGLTLRQTFAKERVLMRREMRKQLCNSETMQIDAYAQVHAAEEVKVVLEFLKSEIALELLQDENYNALRVLLDSKVQSSQEDITRWRLDCQTTEAGFTAASFQEGIAVRASDVDMLLQRLGLRIRETCALIVGTRDELLAEADATSELI